MPQQQANELGLHSWVFSSQLPEQSQRNHRIYHPEKTGIKLPKQIWETSYGDGTGAAGNVFLDKANLAGLEVSSQAVQAATWVSYQFADKTVTDGVIGFGFDHFNGGKRHILDLFGLTIC